MPRRAPRFKPPDPYRGPPRSASKAERDAFYSSARWMRLRAAFLADNPLCVRCLARDDLVVARIAHHRRERLERPDLALDPANLEPLCDSCHTAHHRKRDRRP